MCGNSIGQDRRFLAKYMPKLEAFFHYRNLDVSTLKELAKRWARGLQRLQKAAAHTALADVHESIDELAHYRSTSSECRGDLLIGENPNLCHNQRLRCKLRLHFVHLLQHSPGSMNELHHRRLKATTKKAPSLNYSPTVSQSRFV
jgi:hypothetical protein